VKPNIMILIVPTWRVQWSWSFKWH